MLIVAVQRPRRRRPCQTRLCGTNATTITSLRIPATNRPTASVRWQLPSWSFADRNAVGAEGVEAPAGTPPRDPRPWLDGVIWNGPITSVSSGSPLAPDAERPAPGAEGSARSRPLGEDGPASRDREPPEKCNRNLAARRASVMTWRHQCRRYFVRGHPRPLAPEAGTGHGRLRPASPVHPPARLNTRDRVTPTCGVQRLLTVSAGQATVLLLEGASNI
jgi:hypothetical protein